MARDGFLCVDLNWWYEHLLLCFSPSSHFTWSVSLVTVCPIPKEREMTLHQKRLQKFVEVINQSMDQFTRQNIRFFIEIQGETTIKVQRMDRINREMSKYCFGDRFIQNMTRSCSEILTESLQRWKGVLKSQKFSAQDDVAFKVYFKTAKNWLDQRKISTLCGVFWIPLFEIIEQVWGLRSEVSWNRKPIHILFDWYILESVSMILINLYSIEIQSVSVFSSLKAPRPSSFPIDFLIYNGITANISIYWSCSIWCGPPSRLRLQAAISWFRAECMSKWRTLWLHFKFGFEFMYLSLWLNICISDPVHWIYVFLFDDDDINHIIQMLLSGPATSCTAGSAANRLNRTQNSKEIRNRIMSSCELKLAISRRTFEESLLSLHREAYHLGSDHCCSNDGCPSQISL